jgi:hypothetical protein
MKIYIAGKVTGLEPAVANPKFDGAEVVVKAMGHKAVNPIKVIKKYCDPETVTWGEAMRVLIPHMLASDAVCILPCWAKSRGAILERYLAGCVGIPVYEGLANVPPSSP